MIIHIYRYRQNKPDTKIDSQKVGLIVSLYTTDNILYLNVVICVFGHNKCQIIHKTIEIFRRDVIIFELKNEN